MNDCVDLVLCHKEQVGSEFFYEVFINSLNDCLVMKCAHNASLVYSLIIQKKHPVWGALVTVCKLVVLALGVVCVGVVFFPREFEPPVHILSDLLAGS